MIVCKIWDAEYPWDVRVEKVARTLTDAGHEVHVVARNRDRRAVEEQLPECRVHRLAPLAPRLGGAANAASMFPAFFNPRWARLVLRTARRTGAELILCRDLPLAPTAIWAARRLGVPIVLDMAENYPAMIRAIWRTGYQRPADWLVRNPAIVAAVERWCVHRVDHVLAVVEESRDRLIGLGVPAERITIVSNTPPLGRPAIAPSPPPARGAEDGLRVVYLGNIEPPRGLDTLIEAVARCRRRGVRVHATLIGRGVDRPRLERLARRLGVEDDVAFPGWVSDATALLPTFDVGAIPYIADESWDTTIPNKLFDYMAAGLAVAATDMAPVRRIVRETRCGEVARAQDPDALAAALIRLGDPAHRRRCAAAGRAAVERRYHWAHDARRLLDAIEGVVDGRRPAATGVRP
ncbi:MAG TPA: glycosyltransferase family 4 protein [Longimicrobiales bacterium]